MDRHYYLVAQLPMLLFDRPPGITVEGFLAEAAKWLSAGEHAALARLDLADTDVQPGDPATVRQFKEHERELRQELARWRQTRGTDQEHRPAGALWGAVREGTPLDVELRLLRWRWDFVDELERGHDFDLDFLACYLLKLQLLLRLHRFDAQIGLNAFRTLCEAQA